MKHTQDMFKGGIAVGQVAMFVVTPQEPKSGILMATVLKGRNQSIDCHRAKAAELFKVAYEDVTPEQRAAGKNANYVDWWKS